jgi:putative flippase GtrA
LASNFARVTSQSFVSARLARFAGWFAFGVIAFAFELGLLAVLHQWLGMHLWLASALAGEVVVLSRFLSTDRFVFGHPSPSFSRCWRFHVAAAGSFTVSWLVLNGSAHTLDLAYPVATFLGSVAAFVWSGLTNFLWVWRPRPA